MMINGSQISVHRFIATTLFRMVDITAPLRVERSLNLFYSIIQEVSTAPFTKLSAVENELPG